MEDDIDIYEDLPSFGTEFCENFVSNNEANTVQKEQLELKKQIAELTIKLENFQKVNENLEINLFSLLKTAKAEIARKDKMIDELRKKLDDVTFKRGIHSKTNDYNIHKSTFRETIVNAHHKSIDRCFSSNENNVKTPVTDCSYNQTKDQQNKSALIPITVFGERLLKRMTDEQNLEKKDKYSNKISSSNNDNTNNEGYVIESDKENGFLSDINSCITKEIPSSTVEQYKEDEHIKNSSALLKSTTKDFVLSNKSEINSPFQQKPIFITTDTRKRVNEETNRHIPTKRIKSTGDEYHSKTMKKEIDVSTILDSNSKCSLPHSNNLEPSSHSKEKRYSIKNSITGYTRNSSVELTKHESFVNDTKNEDERKDMKNKNVSYYQKDANERSSKRRNKSVQNSTSTSDRKDIDCYIEVFKKDNYRSNYNEHHHKTKQKEHHRIENHRSRIKSTSYIKPNREDKYSRNQYKHTNYDEKFEERCNFRNIGTDKSKTSKKDSCNAHNEMKYSTTHRVSVNQKGDNVKKTNSYNEYDSRKTRSKDNKQIKRENKRHEYNEYSDRKVNEEHFINHLKYSEVSKQNCEKDNQIIGRMNCILPRESELGIHDELRKYTKRELQNSSIDFEDSEISSSLYNNSLTNGNDACVKLKNQQDARKIPSLLSTASNEVIQNPINHNMKFEATEKSKISSDIPQTTPISNTIITSLQEQKSSENIETTENVENVENIEKFIRDYTTTCDMFTKVPETSNVIQSLNDSALNLITKEENINDVHNYEQNLEACDTLTPNIVLYDENPQINKTFSMFDEKSINTSENHISENNLQLAKNDCVEMQTEQTISLKHAKNMLQENTCIGSKYMKLTEDNNSANNSIQQILEMGAIDHSSKNITKVNVLQNSYPCSTIVSKSSKSSKEMDKKKNDYINVNFADNIIKSSHDNCNNHNENKINTNNLEYISTVSANYKNTNVSTDIIHKRECTKNIEETERLELKEFKKPLQRTRNDNRNTKITSMNVHGKLVVFSRRKKPVCLANNNANMTVLINNKHNASVDLTSESAVKTSSCDTMNTS